MEDILREVRNPLWWFSVVIAGLLVNVTAAYTKGFTDRLFAGASERYRQRLKAAEEARAKRVRTLGEDPQKLLAARFGEIRILLGSVQLFVIAAVLLLVPMQTTRAIEEVLGLRFALITEITCLFLGAIVILMSVNLLRSAMRLRGEVYEAAMRTPGAEPPAPLTPPAQ